MTALQANNSRLVTNNRLIIEAINGVHSSCFEEPKEIRNTQLPHIMVSYKIALALYNCFFLCES